MSFIFMTDGIPIVYYGEEQCTHGNSDPYHRKALWSSGYQSTSSVHLIAKLNRPRHWVIKTDGDYLTQRTSTLLTTATSIAIQKGSTISPITNIDLSVGKWRWFRDVADFDILLASKYQHSRLYSLQVQRYNHQVSISMILCLI